MKNLALLFLSFFFAASLQARKPDTFWTYHQIGDRELKLSVFFPDDYETASTKFPVMVWFHGGSWNAGEPSWHYPDCEYWSKRG
ncbi:MAG: carboxylesterase family protein, partial [Verrucomicrobiota bacterium]